MAGLQISHQCLIPNLSGIRKLCPDVIVAVDNNHELVSFKNDGFDAAIRFSNGDGTFTGLDSVLLFEPSLYAVANPEYLDKHGKLKSPGNPEKHVLIDTCHKLKEVRAMHVHWADFNFHNGFDFDAQSEIYPDGFQAFNAALQGRGSLWPVTI